MQELVIYSNFSSLGVVLLAGINTGNFRDVIEKISCSECIRIKQGAVRGNPADRQLRGLVIKYNYGIWIIVVIDPPSLKAAIFEKSTLAYIRIPTLDGVAPAISISAFKGA
jgi:hypothetical protein